MFMFYLHHSWLIHLLTLDLMKELYCLLNSSYISKNASCSYTPPPHTLNACTLASIVDCRTFLSTSCIAYITHRKFHRMHPVQTLLHPTPSMHAYWHPQWTAEVLQHIMYCLPNSSQISQNASCSNTPPPHTLNACILASIVDCSKFLNTSCIAYLTHCKFHRMHPVQTLLHPTPSMHAYWHP